MTRWGFGPPVAEGENEHVMNVSRNAGGLGSMQHNQRVGRQDPHGFQDLVFVRLEGENT